MADTDEFWTVEEVSVYLRITQSTIYELGRDRVLPGFKAGEHWRLARDTILEWVKGKEGKSSFLSKNGTQLSQSIELESLCLLK